jgi:hypothetical protein
VHHFLDFHRNSPFEKVSGRQFGSYSNCQVRCIVDAYMLTNFYHSITPGRICIDPDQNTETLFTGRLYAGRHSIAKKIRECFRREIGKADGSGDMTMPIPVTVRAIK